MKKNGKQNGEPGASTERAPIAIDRQQCDRLRSVDQEMAALKIQIADLVLQEAALALQKQEQIRKLQQLSDLFVGQVKAVARSHGIDPDDTSKGRWNLDLATMTFMPVTG